MLVGVSLCVVQSRRFVIQDDAAAANRDIVQFDDGKIEAHLAPWGNNVVANYSACRGASSARKERACVRSEESFTGAWCWAATVPRDDFAWRMRGTWRAVLRAGGRIFPGMDVMRIHWNLGGNHGPRRFRRRGSKVFFPFQLFVSTSIGLAVGSLTWLIWFGQ